MTLAKILLQYLSMSTYTNGLNHSRHYPNKLFQQCDNFPRNKKSFSIGEKEQQNLNNKLAS
uniref:Putative ovule protein n=1 Tax=Solanum chacoense TaxID=4108 RepID=A0A0V0GPH3_SOLCH